ncbi:hypothetical protein BaRGS_00000937, partial [Batillaria attramentaria]
MVSFASHWPSISLPAQNATHQPASYPTQPQQPAPGAPRYSKQILAVPLQAFVTCHGTMCTQQM